MKIKINWGTGIVIAIISFMSFILYFVIKISIDTDVKHNLVTEKYYQQEIKFQQEIDARTNAARLKENILVEKVAEGLKIYFPTEFIPEKITGTISLYRPSNKKLDLKIPISISENFLHIPKKHLVGGRWTLSVFWEYNNINYLYKEELNL